jgi:hypothetical protein
VQNKKTSKGRREKRDDESDVHLHLPQLLKKK